MPPVLSHKNNQLYVDLTPLVAARIEQTHLTADVSSGSGTLTVADIDNFSTDQILLIGELGAEGSEIIKTHASTVPSGTTITLAANTSFAHSSGIPVYRLQFDQIEFSHADTAAGSKSVLATAGIQADQKVQVYTDTTETAGFYFARFKETIGNTFGSYTDAVPYGGFASNTVGYMIEQALRDSDTTLSDVITRHDCYRWINECVREIQGKQLRFPQHQNLNAILGQTTRGTFSYTLPSDIYDDDTQKSIISVRIGDTHLVWRDPRDFEEELGEAKYTQVRTQASENDTSLDVDNSYDFADTGTLAVYVSGSKDTFTYTGVTRDDADGATAAFTGIPSSGDDAIGQTTAVDTYVWQDEDEGKPKYFTVRNGSLDIWPLPDATNDNQNIYLDYFTEATEIDSDGDSIDLQRFDIIQPYLTWRIRMKLRGAGTLDQRDGFYVTYKERLNDAIRTNRSVFTHKMAPKINRINYG